MKDGFGVGKRVRHCNFPECGDGEVVNAGAADTTDEPHP